MAIYRLHKKDWERASQIPGPQTTKRKRLTEASLSDPGAELGSELEKEEVEENPSTPNIHRKKRAKTNADLTSKSLPGDGKKGVSSGLSTVIRRGGRRAAVTGQDSTAKHAWWKSLPSAAKGYLRLDR